MPEFRALMAQMAAELDHNRRCLLDDASLTHPLADRARAALSEPADGPAVLRRGPAAVAGQPTDEELLAMRSWSSHGHTFDSDLVDFARAVLARWGNHSPDATKMVPPAEGEVAELANSLRHSGDALRVYGLHAGADACSRAAELLERQAAPVPVPVAERLPGPEDCAPWPGDPNSSHWCWVGRDVDGGWEWEQRSADCLLVSCEDWWTHWLPAHALPLPAQAGEVEP